MRQKKHNSTRQLAPFPNLIRCSVRERQRCHPRRRQKQVPSAHTCVAMAIGTLGCASQLIMVVLAAILLVLQRVMGWLHSSLFCIRGKTLSFLHPPAQPNTAAAILPPQPSGKERLCVALDLDETLVHTFHRELPTSVLLSDLAYIKLYLPRSIAKDAKQPPSQASLLGPAYSLWTSGLAVAEQLFVYIIKSIGLGTVLHVWGGALEAMFGTSISIAASCQLSDSCMGSGHSAGFNPGNIKRGTSSEPRIPQHQGTGTASLSEDTYPVWVVERPGARSFLRRVSAFAELVLYTAAAPEYATPVLQLLLDPDGSLFQGRLIHRNNGVPLGALTAESAHRAACSLQPAGSSGTACGVMQGEGLRRFLPAVKDLVKLGRPLARTLLVDDNSAAFLLHPSNGVPCKPWTGLDAADDHLPAVILPLLQSLALFQDVRPILEARFRLRDWYIRKGLLPAPQHPLAPGVSGHQDTHSPQQHLVQHATCSTTSTVVSGAVSAMAEPAPRAGHVRSWAGPRPVAHVGNTPPSFEADLSRVSAASSTGPQYSSDNTVGNSHPHSRSSTAAGFERHSDEGQSGLRLKTAQEYAAGQHHKMQTLW